VFVRIHLYYQFYGAERDVVLAVNFLGQDPFCIFFITSPIALQPNVKLVAFDLFFHGRSVLNKICNCGKIPGPPDSKFHARLTGFADDISGKFSTTLLGIPG